MKNSYITVTDQFCGAGGSSQGVRRYANKIGGGIEVKLALNHWKLAIETHSTNFPDTLHDCTDISACDPRRYPSTDILITSPECTNHSVANGKKQLKKQMELFEKGIIDPAAERSRATMWDVVRFAEFHKYNIIITENVVDARKWVLYDAWINAMHNLGYEHRCCFLNSMHFWPTPQSRDRMYVVFWRKGNKAPNLDYMPLSRCQKCCKDVRGIQSWKRNQKSWKYGERQGYVYCCPECTTRVEPYYYAALNCIDWSIPGTRIGDRKIPLKGNTERRIRKGINMFKNDPFLMLSAYTDARGDVRNLNGPLYTQTTSDMQGILRPFIINNQQQDAADSRVRSAMDDALFTSSCYANVGVVAPPPVVIHGEHSSSDSPSYVKTSLGAMNTQTTSDHTGILSYRKPMIVELNSSGKLFEADNRALSTLTAGGNNQGLVMMPVIVENKGNSNARSASEAMSCFTTKLSHGILTSEAFQAFITYQNGGSDVNSHLTKAAGTFAANDRHALVAYKEPEYEDCYYRTLKAHEVKKGMAFDDNYIILGDSKSQVRQCGNAVTPPPMEWLVEQSVNSLM